MPKLRQNWWTKFISSRMSTLSSFQTSSSSICSRDLLKMSIRCRISTNYSTVWGSLDSCLTFTLEPWASKEPCIPLMTLWTYSKPNSSLWIRATWRQAWSDGMLRILGLERTKMSTSLTYSKWRELAKRSKLPASQTTLETNSSSMVRLFTITSAFSWEECKSIPTQMPLLVAPPLERESTSVIASIKQSCMQGLRTLIQVWTRLRNWF